MTTTNPLLEEIYKAREELTKAAGGDIEGIFRYLRQCQAAADKKPISPKSKRERPDVRAPAEK